MWFFLFPPQALELSISTLNFPLDFFISVPPKRMEQLMAFSACWPFQHSVISFSTFSAPGASTAFAFCYPPSKLQFDSGIVLYFSSSKIFSLKLSSTLLYFQYYLYLALTEIMFYFFKVIILSRLQWIFSKVK